MSALKEAGMVFQYGDSYILNKPLKQVALLPHRSSVLGFDFGVNFGF